MRAGMLDQEAGGVLKKYLEGGNTAINDGQRLNGFGDQRTLVTVLFTISMFFAGLARVLRRVSIRLVFLIFSVLVVANSAIQMSALPSAQSCRQPQSSSSSSITIGSVRPVWSWYLPPLSW